MRAIRSTAACLLAVFLVTLFATPALAATLRWQWQNPTPTANVLWDVAYGNGVYVAVGEAGTTVVSSDGESWQSNNTGLAVTLRSVVFGNGRFVAVGHAAKDGTGVALLSRDGLTWTQMPLPSAKALRGAAFGGGRFLALGAGGTLLSSADGETWSQAATGVTFDLLDAAYGADRWVVAGGSGVLYSTDGLTWKKAAGPTGGNSVAYGDGRFMLGGRFPRPEQGGEVPTATILTSRDGANWSASRTVSTYESYSEYWYAMVYGADRFVAAGKPGTFISRDGLIWGGAGAAVGGSPLASGHLSELTGVAYGNGLYVGVGGNTLVTSRDGYDWVIRSIWVQGTWYTPPRDLRAVTYGSGLFAAVGDLGTVLTSPDGRTWTRRDVRTGQDLQAVAHGGGRFVAVGWRGTSVWSTDGETWNWSEAGTDQVLKGVAYGKGLFVTVGTAGTIFTSPDGVTWTKRSSGTAQHLSGVTFGNGMFAAVGWEGVITSPDGIRWTAAKAAITGTSITYGGGRFVAAGVGKSLYSMDGVTWNTVNLAGAGELRSVAYGEGNVVMVGHAQGVKGAVLTYADGGSWQTRAESSRNLNGVGYGNGIFVAVGEGGAILSTGEAQATCGQAFPDLPGHHPACSAVEELVARKVINGYPDGTFGPSKPVTRAEFAKMLVLATGRAPAPGSSAGFPDAAGHWAAVQGYLQAAVAAGAINGFPDGTFQPEQPITRAQVTKIAAALRGLSPAGQPPYRDIPAYEWFAGWAAVARTARLIGPEAASPVWTDADFGGNLPATRAEAAMVLSNLMKNQP